MPGEANEIDLFFDKYFTRPPVNHLPRTLICQLTHDDSCESIEGNPNAGLALEKTVDRLTQLLHATRGNRPPFDELILLATTTMTEHLSQLPARKLGVRIHGLIADRPTSGAALTQALTHAKQFVTILTADHQNITDQELLSLQETLDTTDIVFTYRDPIRAGWLTRTWSSLARFAIWPITSIFGVSHQDPMSPTKIFRRQTIAPVHWKHDGDMLHFEMAAKANFLMLLPDEKPVQYDGRVSSLWSLLWRNRKAVARLFTDCNWQLPAKVTRELPYDIVPPKPIAQSRPALASSTSTPSDQAKQEPKPVTSSTHHVSTFRMTSRPSIQPRHCEHLLQTNAQRHPLCRR